MTNEPLKINGETFLTREDVMSIFGVSSVTVWTWVKQGVIRQHHIGKRTYYIESEIAEDIKKSGSLVRKSHKEKMNDN